MKMHKNNLIYFSIILVFLVTQKLFLNAQSHSISYIAESAIPGVVKILIYDITGVKCGQGSGFFIAPGKILTNAHVVEKAYSVEIFSDTESYEQVTILKLLYDVDLALLSVENREEKTLMLENEREILPGERIVTIGNPMGLEKTISDGIVSAIRYIPGAIQIIQISAPISPGSSGGPLLNLQGRVIGITVATISEGQNLNFAIGIETIITFLEKTDNPKKLHTAKARVLWRVILKWIGKALLGLFALAWGGGFWIIFIIIIIFSFLIWLFKGLYNLIKKLFRKKSKYMKENYSPETISRAYEEPNNNSELEQPNLITDFENNEQNVEGFFKFHCWKCGAEVYVDFIDRPDSIECDECGTKLTVPKE